MARVFTILLGFVTPYSRRFYEVYVAVRANVDDFCLRSLKSGGASASEAW